MATIGDLVLIYREGQPAFFARVEHISADHKPGWFQAGLLLLGAPAVEVTWILREPYLNGEDFTMGGIETRIEKIADSHLKARPSKKKSQQRVSKGEKVISLVGKKQS